MYCTVQCEHAQCGSFSHNEPRGRICSVCTCRGAPASGEFGTGNAHAPVSAELAPRHVDGGSVLVCVNDEVCAEVQVDEHRRKCPRGHLPEGVSP